MCDGRGQPFQKDDKILKNRVKAVYESDDKESIRVVHKNSKMIDLYNEFLDKNLSEKCMKILHTRYSQREVLL